MPYQGSKNKVFSRYNTAVLIVFFVIAVAALTVASFRYFNELNLHEQRLLADLSRQANSLNIKLQQSVQAITGIQRFANYYLQYPQELNVKPPRFIQEGKQYYLDMPAHDVVHQGKLLSGNITGTGFVKSFDLPMKQELAMASALTPAFVTAHKINPDATWFYYLSINRFINLYPWLGRSNWRYTDKLLASGNVYQIKKAGLNNKKFYWSPPFRDTASKSMKVSLGTGIYRDQQFIGALVMDMDLESMQKSLPELSSPEHGMVLINEKKEVLTYKSQESEEVSVGLSWSDIIPEEIAALTAAEFDQLADSAKVGQWLVQKHSLEVNGWTLLKFQPYHDFTSPVFDNFVFIFSVLFTGLMAFLGLVYFMTRTTFIKPATEFISHIENCAQGDPGKVKPTADWLHWFQIVEDIFSQNRSLLQQLKEQNAVLDSRVSEKTQALLEKSEQHQRDYALLRSVMNAIPELIIFNDPSGQLIGCNRAFEKFVSQSEFGMLGQQAHQLLPLALGEVMHELARLPNPDNEINGHQRIIKSGELTFELFSGNFFSETGIELGSISIFRDVTSQYAIQSALQQAKEQAEEANEAKSQFLANMSHEIRTPINAIQGMMSLLAKTRLNSHQQHYLDSAANAASSLLHLIEQLLDLSKIEAGKMVISREKTDLDLMVDKALKLNVILANKKNLPVTVDIQADVPRFVETDEMRLVQVLVNLLNNAVKFTHEGTVSLSVELTRQSKNQLWILFRVKDTGIGIEADKQGKLFDAFSQADESMTREYGGSGLGLSICQEIVTLLGGSIRLQSRFGQGSEFSFELPFSRVDSGEAKQEVMQDITLCTLGFALPESLLAVIEDIGWQHREIECIEMLDSLNRQQVLLLESEYLVTTCDEFVREISAKSRKNLLLLGVCQPMLTEITEQTSQQLDKLKIPYLLLEKPLYRNSLHALVAHFQQQPQLTAQVEEADVKTLIEEAADSLDLTGIRVLLVEDNLVNQMVASELLTNMQASVIIADNGQKAIESLAEHEVDVILMDIQMPVMDGLTATKQIRSQDKYRELPIIAMTAHARDEDREKSFAVGMNKHISKPVKVDVLRRSILEVVKSVAV
ncbi:ATP-binding protein [Thalassomonas haliotis]|uniref:histidine kinase n=1 Tax=Thalassomonas haliotis TaxID=485448 RepID=A0ABY7VG45_9GAMM|nr:ATP-binding protein [Thalassomonas haliotis]WDE12382.1 response regulator [Thalassomonas haliotis]